MELQHIINLTVMARRGLAVASEQLRPAEGKAVWEAIEAAEKTIEEAQKEAQKQTTEGEE